LVTNILKPFLSSQFDIGTGAIINPKGDQSDQTDIIICDTRTIPPFIKEPNLGGHSAEIVIGGVEVKSSLSRPEMEAVKRSARKQPTEIFSPISNL
jgi:hypothetical protein